MAKSTRGRKKQASKMSFFISTLLGVAISVIIQVCLMSNSPCKFLDRLQSTFLTPRSFLKDSQSPHSASLDQPENPGAGAHPSSNQHGPKDRPGNRAGNNGLLINPDSQKNLVLVGVMTAQKFLNTRVLAGYRTWAKTIPGRVIYFCSDLDYKNDTANLTDEALYQHSAPNFKPKRLKLPVSEIPNDEDQPLIISLPGVNDAYPPQKKSFMMLKFMHDNFLNDFKWFVRADDDVFIKGDQLGAMLRSLNDQEPHFIGQTGQGLKEEMGLLNLNYDENFCMGGPSMTLSSMTLRKMGPHIKYCLNHLYTFHEDIEIGRCIRGFAGVPCTWAYESQNLFLHYSYGSIWIRNNTKKAQGTFDQAITLHPFKNHEGFYDSQVYFLIQKLRRYRNYLWQLKIQKNHHQRAREDLISHKKKENLYQYYNVLKDYILMSQTKNNPRQKIGENVRTVLNDVKNDIVKQLNKLIRSQNMYFTKAEILWVYGAIENPLQNDFYVNMLLTYRRRGSHSNNFIESEFKITQPYIDLIFQDADTLPGRLRSQYPEAGMYNDENIGGVGQASRRHHLSWKPMFDQIVRRLQSEKGAHSLTHSEVLRNIDNNADHVGGADKPVNFIVPLLGRVSIFKRFLRNFEVVYLKNRQMVTLLVVAFKDSSNNETTHDIQQFETMLTTLKQSYPHYRAHINIVTVKGEFSRGLALEIGASQYGLNELLFFVDVDMVFDYGVLGRIRQFTQFNDSIYYPIVFSQYNPHFNAILTGQNLYNSSQSDTNASSYSLFNQNPSLLPFGGLKFDVSEGDGYWRSYGFGIVSIYRHDFVRVGGFDMGIFGWGKEDVDLYDKCIAKKYTIYHSPDPGLIHVFHDSVCPSNLKDDQFIMCLKSKANNLASNSHLYKYIYTV